MNKEKLVKIKNKIKKNAPEIMIAVSAVAVAAYGIYGVAKQVKTAGSFEFEPLPMVDRETQKTLMEDADFGLYKLTDDEYMFARIIAD